MNGSVLIGGFLRATWRLEHHDAGSATLSVDHVGPLTKRATSAVTAEGRRLLKLNAPDATTHDIRIAPLPEP